MSYQVINTLGNDKREARLKKEFNEYSSKIDSIKIKSQNLLASLKQLVDKNKAERISSLIRNNLSHE